MKLLTLKDVEDITSLSKTTIYEMVKAGNFPQPVKLGPRSTRWYESEVLAHIEALPRGVDIDPMARAAGAE